MRRVSAISMLALILGSFALAPMAAAQYSQEDIAAMMPSKAEMRAQMEAAGMDPAMMEQVLANMPDNPSDLSANDQGDGPCLDANDNDICDDEENDPEIKVCRKFYLNAIEKVAKDTYGRRLGDNALQIGQTCSVAAIGGSMKNEDGAWFVDINRMTGLNAYWEAVIAHGRYLNNNPMIADPRFLETDEEFNRAMAQFAPDLRSMMSGGPSSMDGTAFRVATIPVHNRCENIRRYVGKAWRNSVHDKTICLPQGPEPQMTDMPETETPDGEK